MSDKKSLWTEGRYSSWYFAISKNVKGSVCWRAEQEDKNYTAYFLGQKLGSWDASEDARKAVESRAKRELEYALKNLFENSEFNA